MSFPLAEQSLAMQQRLLGDGMSLACVVAWQLYCMSHTVRREAFTFIHLPPRFNVPVNTRRTIDVDVSSEESVDKFAYEVFEAEEEEEEKVTEATTATG